jgi:hypothetical protein
MIRLRKIAFIFCAVTAVLSMKFFWHSNVAETDGKIPVQRYEINGNAVNALSLSANGNGEALIYAAAFGLNLNMYYASNIHSVINLMNEAGLKLSEMFHNQRDKLSDIITYYLQGFPWTYAGQHIAIER